MRGGVPLRLRSSGEGKIAARRRLPNEMTAVRPAFCKTERIPPHLPPEKQNPARDDAPHRPGLDSSLLQLFADLKCLADCAVNLQIIICCVVKYQRLEFFHGDFSALIENLFVHADIHQPPQYVSFLRYPNQFTFPRDRKFFKNRCVYKFGT